MEVTVVLFTIGTVISLPLKSVQAFESGDMITFLVGRDISSFVDLATASMGEDDLSSAKTKSVLNAMNGFSPLIYDLEENSDYQAFISCCEKVWEALSQNPYLVKNLVGTVVRAMEDITQHLLF